MNEFGCDTDSARGFRLSINVEVDTLNIYLQNVQGRKYEVVNNGSTPFSLYLSEHTTYQAENETSI